MQNRLSTQKFYSVFESYEDFGNKNPIQTVRNVLNKYETDTIHFHNCMEIGRCIAGEGTYCFSDKVVPYKKGDVQIIFPYQSHYALAKDENTPSEWYFTSFEPLRVIQRYITSDLAEFGNILDCEMALYGIFSPEEMPDLTWLINDIIDGAKSKEPYAMEACTVSIMRLLYMLAQKSRNIPEKISCADPALKKVIPALRLWSSAMYSDKEISAGGMARECSLSPSRFRAVFSDATGMSPKKFIDYYRLKNVSGQLLSGNKKITDIAYEAGFDDISAFNRAFKKQYGVSPSEYKKIYVKH